MKKRLISVLIALMTITAASSTTKAELAPYDPGTMSYPISLEQAEESARTWAGDSQLALTVTGVSTSAMDPDEPPVYVLRTTDETQEFVVNCISGEMVLWTDNTANEAYCAKVGPAYDESNMLPLATLHSIATQFLAQKYANYSSMNMWSGNPSVPACYYYQTLAEGVHYMRSFAMCVVDEWSGQIVRYCGEHGPPVTISIVPNLTNAQAEDVALDYAGLIPMYVDGSTVYPQSAFILENHGLNVHSDALDVQRLYWEMRMVISHEAGYTIETYYQEAQERPDGPTGDVMLTLVDAHAGEVFHCEPDGPMGGTIAEPDRAALAKVKNRKPDPARLKRQPRFAKGWLEVDGTAYPSLMYPPLDVGGSGYIHVRCLPTLYRGSLSVSSNGVELKIGDKVIVLRGGSSTLTIDGKVTRMSQPIRVIAGRAYVPSCAVRLICDADASWDARNRVLRIKSGSIPLDSRFRYATVSQRSTPPSKRGP